jgi:hypothetical protein
MRKILVTIALILTTQFVYSQLDVFGWTGSISASKLHLYKVNGYVGFRWIVPWYTIEPTDGNLSFTAFKATLKQIADSGLQVEVQIWADQYAPIGHGVTWMLGLGVQTYMTDDVSNPGPYPNVYNSVYINRWERLHKAIADTLLNLPTYIQAHIESLFVTCGSTGDLVAYHGNPLGTTYGIANDATWQTYYRARWTVAYNYYQEDNGFMVNSFNSGNNYDEFDFILDSLPGSRLKHPNRAHTYPLTNETFILTNPTAYIFDECDDDIKNSTNKANHLQLVRSFVSSTSWGRIDFMDEWNSLAEVDTLVDFVYKYRYQHDTTIANKGFCVLAQKVNHLDTINYPTTPYGALWTNQNSYNIQYNVIATGTDPVHRKEMRYGALAYNMRNPTRVNNIKVATGAALNIAGPYLLHDYSFYVKDNYELNMLQLLKHETTEYVFRVDGGSIYGRNAGKPKSYLGKTKLYFTMQNYLLTTTTNDVVKFTVTYKDEGTARWKIQAYRCATMSITNTNSGTWKQATLTVSKFKSKDLHPTWNYGADVVVEVISGQTFPIDMIEAVDESTVSL